MVITTGTFLRGRIHIGTTTKFGGGRAGESAATHLAEQLEEVGLTVARFKTGTPPRIDGRSVDFDLLERQESEIEQFDYSWSHFWRDPRRRGETTRHPVQMPCWITFLGEDGKRIIQENIGSSAMYGGAIGSRGPRYCPSVEDKIVKFPAAERHQLFLEPEGHDTSELYVNGLSTSLPAPVQVEILRTVPGLERVRMTRAGYAIEYDYYPPTQLDATLQVKAVAGLFFAGQINGTTGYEEAAGQGTVAGLNAARFSRRLPGIVLGRESSYIGVLIDDLVTRGVDEPYRLFTSRSEFRLTVRQDNALRRLSPVGLELALYTPHERATVSRRAAGRSGRGRVGGDHEHQRGRRGARSRPGQQLADRPIREDRRTRETARRVAGRPVRRDGSGARSHSGRRRDGRPRDQVRRLFRSRTRPGGEVAANGRLRARCRRAVRRHAVALARGSAKARGDSAGNAGAGVANSRRQPYGSAESRSRVGEVAENCRADNLTSCDRPTALGCAVIDC